MGAAKSCLMAGGALLALCGAAVADGSPWQTVTLDGGIAIDVPGAVGNGYKPDAKGATAIVRLADNTRDILYPAPDGATDSSLLESDSLSASGYPAGRCATSYRRANDKEPGQIVAAMGVAAPDAFYLLSCTVYAPSVGEVQFYWETTWKADAHHIEESVAFPRPEK
jgi:hypothetical protein